MGTSRKDESWDRCRAGQGGSAKHCHRGVTTGDGRTPSKWLKKNGHGWVGLGRGDLPKARVHR